MSRSLDFTHRLVLEPPDKVTTRLHDSEFYNCWEFLFLDNQHQLIVYVPLEQSLILISMSLLSNVFEIATLVQVIKGMMHKIEHINRNRNRVLNTFRRQFDRVAVLVEYVRVIEAEHFNLVADSFVTQGQILGSELSFVKNSVHFNIKAEFSKVELLIHKKLAVNNLFLPFSAVIF